jgi:hypothetical protein
LKVKDAKKLIVAVLVLAAAAPFAACGSGSGRTGETSTIVSGDLIPVAGAPDVYTDVSGEADIARSDSRTIVSISASGLQPNTAYVAHLHTGGCDQADPGGPHFQFEEGGSEEPPNEIHLEFTSDAAGEGKTQTSTKREVPNGEAGSVVLHVEDSHEMTSLEAGEAEVETVFVHEGVDHSEEGAGHPEEEPQHSHSDKIACAELEGAAAAEGGAGTAGGDVPTIVVRDGEPVGGVQELGFDAGEEVRFRVSSDEAEEIHVHGYDLAKDVPAGGTVEFAFPAELEGIYEVELEGQAVQIAELQINP